MPIYDLPNFARIGPARNGRQRLDNALSMVWKVFLFSIYI